MRGTGRPRALFLCHRIPYPPDKGDKIRSYHLLRFLAERYDVSLGCFVDDPEDMIHRRHVEALCDLTLLRPLNPKWARIKSAAGLATGEALTMRYYRDRAMASWVKAQRALGPVVEIGFSSSMAPYLRGARAPVLMDLVDADSAKWSAYAQEGGLLSQLIYGREARCLAKVEASIVERAARTYLVSPEEASLVRALPGVDADKVDWFRNGIDTDYWRADARFDRLAPGFDIVFTGAMDYRPNIDAVTWFLKEVWPALTARYGALRFGIVGARPGPAITQFDAMPGVTVTGRVADMRPYLASARVAVAPLRIARGVQNKVLEAMAMGTPVVASTGGVTGTGAVPGTHLLVADTPKETVAAIGSLFDDSQRALALGAAAGQYIRDQYPWADTLARLAPALP